MKSKKLLLVFILFLLIGIFVQFLSYDYVLDYLKKDLSSDGIIEKTTYTNYESKFQFMKILFVVIPLLCVIFILFQNKIAEIISYFNTNIPRLINAIYSSVRISHIFWFSLVMILVLSIYAVYNFDVGEDEAWFLNDIQNINKYGSVFRDFGDNKSFYYDIPNLPLNIVSNLTVPLFGFSITHIRIIVLIFALLLIPVLFMLFDELTVKLVIIFIFLFPGIFSLTSAVFLEFTAFLFLILSLILLKQFEEKNKNYLLILSALLMSLSMATKIQFALLMGLTLIVLFFVEHRNKLLILFKYLLFIILFYLMILSYSFFHYGFHNGALLFKFVFLGGNQSVHFNFDLPLAFNKFLILNNLIFIPLLLFIWIRSWRIITENCNFLYMKIIFTGAITILIYWNLFFGMITWRNVFIGIALNLILFAVYLKHNYRSAKLLLIPYVLVGITANLIFVQNGIHNEVQYYNVHLLDNLLSIKRNDDQKVFFNQAAEIIKPVDEIYVPADVFMPRLYLHNQTVKGIRNYERSGETQYLIVRPVDFKENWMDDYNIQSYIPNSKKILQVGDHILYQLP